MEHYHVPGEIERLNIAEPQGHERGCLRNKHKSPGVTVGKRTKFQEWTIPVMSIKKEAMQTGASKAKTMQNL